jgi:hypothetical protein
MTQSNERKAMQSIYMETAGILTNGESTSQVAQLFRATAPTKSKFILGSYMENGKPVKGMFGRVGIINEVCFYEKYTEEMSIRALNYLQGKQYSKTNG